MATLNIKGLDKAEVFRALFNSAKVQRPGFFHNLQDNISLEKAQKAVAHRTHFRSYRGRILNINITGSYLETRFYDQENGPGAAEKALSRLLAK